MATSRPKRRRRPQSAPIALGTTLTIAGVSALKTILSRTLDATTPVELDCSALQVADTAGLQLLLAFLREADSRSVTVTLAGATPELAQTAALLGLMPHLSAWLTPAAQQ